MFDLIFVCGHIITNRMPIIMPVFILLPVNIILEEGKYQIYNRHNQVQNTNNCLLIAAREFNRG